jgi:hypothetical protein
MPLPGGASDKAGNRYEAYWTIYRLLDVLDEKYDSIRLEPPASEDHGFEFWIRRDTALEFHQTKRQHSARGQWSLADLDSHGVLGNIGTKLQDDSASCFFVSTQDVPSLRELGERARGATSFDEFQRVFLSSQHLLRELAELRTRWRGISERQAFGHLRRISIETVSEDFLRRSVENRIASMMDGNPVDVFDSLFVLVFSSVHRELTALDIWTELKKRGVAPNWWRTNTTVLAAVDEQNKRYLSALTRELIGGTPIKRRQADVAVMQLLSGESPKAVMFTGRAGEGKSVTVLQVVDALTQRGVPVLAFRVDRLDPVRTPDEVGKQLSLPASPTRVLAAIAQGKIAVLVMDQLDAISKLSGRNPHFLDCLLEMIEQAGAFPKIKIVLACRRFDLENDERLRRLIGNTGVASETRVSSFSRDEVKDVVCQLGFDPALFSEQQLALLSLPLNLSLLARIAETAKQPQLQFATLHDLYGLFWGEKSRSVTERRGVAIQWNKVIDTLCEIMSTEQRLAVPLARLDDYREDVQALASEHVLVIENGLCSFFHESFFDYAFARRFAAHEHSVTAWLRSDDQDLFRRAQVRQILQYLREEDRERYLHEIQQLLTSPDIRFHLKWMIFAWLAQLPEPTSDEWNAVRGLLGENAPAEGDRLLVLDLLRRSAPWFLIAFSKGDLSAWLAGEDEAIINAAVDILTSNARKRPMEVCELLTPLMGKGGAWVSRIRWILQRADLGADRCLFDLFIQTIDCGFFDRTDPKLRRDDFWSYMYSLGADNPSWAIEALAHMIRRSSSVSLAKGETNPFDDSTGSMPQDGAADHTIEKIYKAEPARFANQLLDPLKNIIEMSAAAGSSGTLLYDTLWRYRHFGGGYSIESKFLDGIEHGLRFIAANDPDQLQAMVPRLIEGNYESLHFLAARAYAANGEIFGDEAVDFLCSGDEHLCLGYIDGRYASTDLIRSISPFCSDNKLLALESKILNYYSRYERTAGGRQAFGYAQFELLSAMERSRLSEKARKRLAELERKFGKKALREPQKITFHVVGSPIPEAALRKMTDDQWLRAISTYNKEETFDLDGLRGGARQLSQGLHIETKANPKRFAALLGRFPVDVHPFYISDLLRALSDSNAGTEIILRACDLAHERSGKRFGQWICYCIGRLASEPLPESALEMVAWYAAKDPDPEDTVADYGQGAENNHTDRLAHIACNSVRGAGADAIAKLIHASPDRLDYFKPTIVRLVQDLSPAVRSQVGETLVASLRQDREFAVQQFVRLCDAPDFLLGTHYLERFIYFAARTHFPALFPILLRMVRSADKHTRKAGARQVSIAALVIAGAHEAMQECLAGPDDLRTSVAEVLASNVGSANYRQFCADALMKLFHDESKDVRVAAAKYFDSFGPDELSAAQPLMHAFIGSPAFEDGYSEVLDALDKSTAVLPEAILSACKRFLTIVGAEAASIAHHAGAWAATASRLVVRAYGQSRDPAFRRQCLDLMDGMLAVGALDASEAMQNFER